VCVCVCESVCVRERDIVNNTHNAHTQTLYVSHVLYLHLISKDIKYKQDQKILAGQGSTSVNKMLSSIYTQKDKFSTY